MRTFTQRRRERIERLQRRAEFLADRIGRDGRERQYDKQERSAVLWALKEIARLDAIEDALAEVGMSDGQRLLVVEALIDNRHRPSDADMERTPQLARHYAAIGEEGT